MDKCYAKMTLVTIAALAVGLSGCSHPTTTGAAVGGVGGAAAGAFLGGAATFFTPAAGPIIAGYVIGGTIVGGLLGAGIGHAFVKHIDHSDRIKIAEAIVGTPINQGPQWESTDTRWSNAAQRTSFLVHPIQQYKSGDMVCRHYKVTIWLGRGRGHSGQGTSCLLPDGGWKTFKRAVRK